MTGDNGIVKRMQIGGIVRSTSAMNNADGNCEEIINLRQDTGVWRVVGKKKVKVEDVGYEQVFLHQYGDFANYLGVKKWNETEKDETGMTVVKTRRAVVWFDPDTKEEKQEICRVEGEATLEQINNILLVKDSIKQRKALYIDGFYTSELVGMPDMPKIETKVETKEVKSSEFGYFLGNTESFTNDNYLPLRYLKDNIEEANELLTVFFNKLKEQNKDYIEGYVFLCVTYKLFDGSETKPTLLLCKKIGEYKDNIYDAHTSSLQKTPDALNPRTNFFIQKNTKGKLSLELGKISIKLTEIPSDRAYNNIIEKVCVYASKPISLYDLDNVQSDYVRDPYGHNFYYVLDKDKEYGTEKENINAFPRKILKNKDISRLLLYRVSEFNLKDQTEFVELDFKDITTNPTLTVDASGWMNTTGDMFVYNNRLHLFKLKEGFAWSDKIKSLWSFDMVNGVKSDMHSKEATFVFYLKSVLGDSKIVTKNFIIDSGDGINMFLPFITFPDSRAYKLLITYQQDDKMYKNVVDLEASETYNFSFYFNPEKIEFIETDIINTQENSVIFDNTKILVSEIANPYFFPPEHSYSLPGEIINLAVNTQQISASQIGQFPLYAFTTEGIYALQQGEGKVLYSNVIPVSAEVAVKGSSVLQTKYGIVFVTADGLKLISGSEVIDLSEAVKGRIDEYFMKQRSYSMILEDSWLWNASPFISRIPFEEYIQKAVMGYDIVKDEIIVSNPAYRYSYVYSLKTKTWHKITEVFSSFSRHLALKQNWPSGHDVCDIREEVKGIRPVFMLTRPVNLGNFGYNMVYHYCMRGEIRPLKEEERCNSLSVFLSNDLQYWEFGPQANPIIDMPVVPLDRLLCASRYFRLLYTGEVEPEHTLALVEMDGEEKFDNKIR